MKTIFGRLSLAISKKTNESFDEFIGKFSDLNIEGIDSLNFRMNDGSIHTFKVEDHFIDWEDEA